MLHPRIVRALWTRRRTAALLAATLFAAACSGGGDPDGVTPADEAPGEPQPAAPTTVTAPDDSAGEQAEAAAPLGFDQAVFEVPEPPPAPDAIDGLPVLEDSDDLIFAGVDAGVWTEADAIRAVLSVLVGELPATAIPTLDELPHTEHSDLLLRARQLIDDPTIDDATRNDLERLTSFWFDDLLVDEVDDIGDDSGDDSTVDEGAAGDQLFALAGLRPARQECGIGESVEFQAYATSTCYRRIVSEEGDTVFVPADDSGANASAQIFEIIERARSGYPGLTDGSELPTVRILISPREAPPEARDEVDPGDVLAHVASATSQTCRIAIFSTSDFWQRGDMFEFTVAHELFHCIQANWGSSYDKFTYEGGADYFAYQLLGECVAQQVALGETLDAWTAQQSLLEAAYSSWFFWQYLDDHQDLTPQQIALLHRTIIDGADVAATVETFVSDLPQALNEFYVRLMGPGLACGFQGIGISEVGRPIDQQGPIDLDASLWQGTRYRLDYQPKYLFQQVDHGPGPIGMAEWDRRADEASWVTTEPEIRTTCDEDRSWIVVVSALDQAAGTHELEVVNRFEGGCDPCLLGEWEVDLATMTSYFEQFIPSGGQEIEFSLSGSWRLGFAPSSNGSPAQFVDTRDLLISAALGGANASNLPGNGLSFSLQGEGRATYTANERTWSMSGYTNTGSTNLGGSDTPFANASAGGGYQYVCEADDLTFQMSPPTPPTDVSARRVDPIPEGRTYFS